MGILALDKLYSPYLSYNNIIHTCMYSSEYMGSRLLKDTEFILIGNQHFVVWASDRFDRILSDNRLLL